jgi:hypothetical protein
MPLTIVGVETIAAPVAARQSVAPLLVAAA